MRGAGDGGTCELEKEGISFTLQCSRNGLVRAPSLRVTGAAGGSANWQGRWRTPRQAPPPRPSAPRQPGACRAASRTVPVFTSPTGEREPSGGITARGIRLPFPR